MYLYSNNIVNTAGAYVPNASISVISSNGSLATIYSDNGITQAANPLTSNSSGAFSFYAPAGNYTLSIYGQGISTLTLPITLGAQPPNFSDQEVPTGAINGFNQSFVLASAPNPPASCSGYLRHGTGAAIPLVFGTDFTLSGKNLSMSIPPNLGATEFKFSYRY